MFRIYLRNFSFFFGDLFVGAISFCLASYLFSFVAPWIGKPTLSSGAFYFFIDNAFCFLLGYGLFNYLGSSLKHALVGIEKLGWLGLASTTGFYVTWMTLWADAHGYLLKTFLGFSFLILWMVGLVFRIWVLRLLALFSSRYFKDRPSAEYIVVFIGLILSCAVLIAIKKESIAEKLADWAYFALLTSVLMELFQLIGSPDKDCEDGD